jgi:predicted nucleic acid-binding protein
MYTVDASVLVNGADTVEAGHEISRACLDALRDQAQPLILPSLVLAEVAGSFSRTRDDAAGAVALVEALRRFPTVTLVNLTRVLARNAAALAAQHRLRGADAVYAAVALRAGTTLITRDREQRERLIRVVPVLSPAEVLEILRPPPTP